jgi:hypothetical protein
MKAATLFHKLKRLLKRFPVVGGVRMNAWTIPTVVVTINIWVNQVQLIDLILLVKKSVLLRPEEQVLSEVPKN